MPLVVTIETVRVLWEVRTEAKGTIKDLKTPGLRDSYSKQDNVTLFWILNSRLRLLKR